MYIRRYSKKVVKKERRRVKKKREKESVYVCMYVCMYVCVCARARVCVCVRACKKEKGCMRACEWQCTLCISTHCYIYTYYTVCFFVFLFVSSPLFSIINFPLRSFLSLATFYELAETDLPYSSCPSSFSPSIDTTTSYHRPKAAIEPM